MGLIKQYIPALEENNTVSISGPCRIGISINEKDLMLYPDGFSFTIYCPEWSQTRAPVSQTRFFKIGTTGRYDFEYTLDNFTYIRFSNCPNSVLLNVAYD